MGIRANDGSWKTAQPRCNDGGTWKTPQEVWAKDGSVWVRVWPEVLTGFLSPTLLEVTGSGQVLSTSSTTITVTNGSGSYSYDWTISNPLITILSPTSPTTAFRASPPIGETHTGLARCWVTDLNTDITTLIGDCDVVINRI